MADLSRIYQPIQKELREVEEFLAISLSETKNKSILKINRFLLESGGKRIRPALVILSAKSTSRHKPKILHQQLIKIASSVELIHMASLIHDDVIDQALRRHHQETLHKKFGEDVSIAFGDYLYAKAFELISSCQNLDILSCISQATRLMCEGELIQVLERDNLDLWKERYIVIVKKKTAGLFAASCQTGTILANCNQVIQNALKEYGLNFGIAFQIIDDCLDLAAEEKDLGKTPGADFKMGELTLPLLNLLSQSKDKRRIISLIRETRNQAAFGEIRKRFIHSSAFRKTKKDTIFYIQKAKRSLRGLKDSCFKQSLFSLADYIGKRLG